MTDTSVSPDDPPEIELHELEQKHQNRIPRTSSSNGDILVERNTDDSAYVVADEDGQFYEGIGDELDKIDSAERELLARLTPFTIATKRLGMVEITPSTKFYSHNIEQYLSVDSVTVDGEGRLYIKFTVDSEVKPPLRSFTYDTETLARHLEAGVLETPQEIDGKLRELMAQTGD